MRKNYISFTLIFIISTFLSGAQVPIFQWAKSFGGVGGDVGNSIAVDASGNVYTTGSFSGTVDFDPGVGVYTLTSATSDVFISKLNSSGDFVWAQQLAGTGFGVCNSIAVDNLGNVYTAGYFLGVTDFDPGPGSYTLASQGGYDIFVSKLNSSGALVWVQKMGGSSYDLCYSVAVDAGGNVYTTGTFQGAGDYDPGVGSFILTPAGSAGAFVSKLNSSGAFVWAKQFEASNTAVGNCVKADASGNVYTAGFFSGAADLDPGAGTFPFFSAGSTDVFISKLNSSGAFVWAAQMGGTSGDLSTSVVVDPFGNVYSTGRFEGTVDFDPGAGVSNLTPPGAGADVFISKLNSSGTFVWAQQLGGALDDISNSIALDTADNVYTAGYFSGTSDFDPGAGTFNLTSAGAYEIFISKINSSGSFIWAKKMGGTDIDICTSIIVDGIDQVYTTGYFSDTPDFDPDAGTYTLTSAGSNDVYVHKMSQCFIPPSPTNATLPNGQGICNGQSATLTAASAGAVNWFSTPSGTTVLGTGANFITPTLSLGTYTYYAEATTCLTNTLRTVISITVSTLPVFSASTNVFVLCVGETATLTVTGVSDATWTPGGTGTSILVSPTVTTTYTVYGSNGPGCANMAVLTQAVSDCSGIQQLTNTNPGLKIYPNPFDSKITIVTAGTLKSRVSIFNTLGALIYSATIGNDNMPPGTQCQTTEINLSGQTAGIYFVKVEQNNLVRTLKIVKE